VKALADQTLYEILDVPPAAGTAEIAAALDRTLTLIGPGSLAMYSLMSPEDTTTLARRVEEARTTLLDPAARARYDAALAGEHPSAAAAPAPELPPVIPALKPEQVMLDRADEEVEEPEEVALTPVPGEGEGVEATRGDAGPAQAATADASEAGRAAPEPAPAGAAPPAAPEAAPEPGPERPALTPAPAHVWPAVQPPPALPAEAAPPLLLTDAVPATPRPIPLEREVTAPRPATTPAPVAPPAAVRTPSPREPSIPEFASWTGDALRSVREARGLSLQRVSERTKVTRHHIENIEADRYTALPAPVYLRGILLSLARELRLDGQKVSRSYLERMAAALAPPPPGPPRR
jgi:hypothetical protein